MTHATSPAAVWKERAREAMTRFVAVREQGDLAAVDEISGKDLTHHAPPSRTWAGTGSASSSTASARAPRTSTSRCRSTSSTAPPRCTAGPSRPSLSETTPLLPGIEATGKHTTGPGAHVLHWSREQVSEAWHVGDRLGWLTMAGVLPPMPGTGT